MGVGVLAGPCAAEDQPSAVQGRSAKDSLGGPESILGSFSFTSQREPIAITSDALEFNYRSRVLKYVGAVVATQGDMKLQSRTLTVTLDGQVENRIKEVVADGQVRVSKGSRWATGGRAVFNQDHHTVILSDNAELHDGGNVVKGDRVIVYLDEERSVVEGGKGRVEAVLVPSQNEETPSPTGGSKP
ncbi:MAG: lipopolysaccharide transport periplasmic protein LptA [Deltaproteobacteria bacterium]|nr:lipopolysaccharide transport periplasmic protein LptA [Deltaproteobacteria bacterium]